MKIARIYDNNGQSRFTDIDISLNEREPGAGVSGLVSGSQHPSLLRTAFSCLLHGASWNGTWRHDANWLSSCQEN